MADDVILTGPEAAAIKALPGKTGRPVDPDSRSSRLRSGAVVFVPGGTHAAAAGVRSGLKGYRVHMRTAERDGVAGIYVWAEPKDAI